MTRFFVKFAILLTAMLPAPVLAQGVFDMGALTQTLSIDSVTQSEKSRAEQQKTLAVTADQLDYKVSLDARKRNLAQFVEKTRAVDPASADQLQDLFSSVDIIPMIGTGISKYGLRTDNVADAFTVYWISAWMASRGRTDENTAAQIAAVRKQAVEAMAATPELLNADDAVKQEFAEILLIQGALLESTVEGSAGNPEMMKQVQAAARQGAMGMNFDLDAMELTDQGFVPAKRK